MGRITFLSVIVIFSCLILFTGCKVVKPSMPVEGYEILIQKPKTSNISLYADIEITKLEQLINDQLNNVIYQDTSFEDNNRDNLKFKALRDGDIKLSFEQNELKW